MKKSDLKSGMIVELRYGAKYMVMEEGTIMFLINSTQFETFSDWNEDLLIKRGTSSWDIVKIHRPEILCQYREAYWNEAPVIWVREEKKTIKIFDRSIEFTESELIELRKQLGE